MASVTVLGIDPGLTRMGYGVVEADGPRLTAVASGTLTTSPDDPIPSRLAHLWEGIEAVIDQWKPDAVAIERVYMKLNRASGAASLQAAGVAMLAAARRGLPVSEYSASAVKQAVTGTGTATKEQVGFMVERLLGSKTSRTAPDAADGLAVAITRVHSGP